MDKYYRVAQTFFMDTFYIFLLASRHNKYITAGVGAQLQQAVRTQREQISRKLKRKKTWQKLVYVEAVRGVDEALVRERQISRYSRAQLEGLIESVNPGWDSISLTALEKSGFSNLCGCSIRGLVQ